MDDDRRDELIRDAIHEQFDYDPALLAELLARFDGLISISQDNSPELA